MTARAGEHRKLDDASICALNLVTRQARQGIMAWGEREGGTHTTRFDRPSDGRTTERMGDSNGGGAAHARWTTQSPMVERNDQDDLFLSLVPPSSCLCSARPAESLDGRRCRTREELRSRALSRTRSGQAERASDTRGNECDFTARGRGTGEGGREGGAEGEKRGAARSAGRAGEARRRDRLLIAYRR